MSSLGKFVGSLILSIELLNRVFRSGILLADFKKDLRSLLISLFMR